MKKAKITMTNGNTYNYETSMTQEQINKCLHTGLVWQLNKDGDCISDAEIMSIEVINER